MEIDEDVVRGLKELYKFKIKRHSTKKDRLIHIKIKKNTNIALIKNDFLDLPQINIEAICFLSDSSMFNSIGMCSGENFISAFCTQEINEDQPSNDERWGSPLFDKEHTQKINEEIVEFY